MGELICEIIPCKDFNERIKLTKNFLKQGIIPENWGNLLLVHYNTNGGYKFGTIKN